jgi:penicillin-binding protein 1B
MIVKHGTVGNLMKKKHFRYLLYAVLVLFITLSAYVVSILNDAKQSVQLFKIRSSVENIEKSILEEGSSVDTRKLHYFQLFTENKVDLNSNSKSLIIDQTLKLSELVNNDCERVYCFQHRIDFSKLPVILWKGLLGVEDYRFLDHSGVDPVSILRAIIVDIKEMKLVQGGSTLTQQLVKNLFLTTKKTFDRKFKELIYSLYLESVMEKEEILSAYFNEVFWGTFQGIYIKGVYSASIAYFSKPVDELSDYESTILISLLKGPYFYRPNKYADRLKTRVDSVYKRLLELGLVRENQKWSQRTWQSWVDDYKKRAEETYFHSMHLVTKDFQGGISPFEKFSFVEASRSILDKYKKQYEGYDFAVKAYICKDDCENNFKYYSKLERERDKGIIEERHQVGSVLKPIVYYTLTKFGKNWEDVVSGEPLTLKLLSGNWTPSEASKKLKDEYTIKEALQLSRNIPIVRLANEVGFDEMEPLLQAYVPELLTPLKEYPAQLLGAVEMSLGELQKAYELFFNNVCADIKKGKYTHRESILHHMSEADKTTLRRVSHSWFKNMQVFGKTGTSNDGLDNWFIARTARTFYAIWFGVESERAGKKVYSGGSSTSFRIFQSYLENRGRRVSDSVCL